MQAMLDSFNQWLSSQDPWISGAVLVSTLHSMVAAILLWRNAAKIANWRIKFYRALLGQFAVFAVALGISAGFVAAVFGMGMARTVAGNVLLGLAPIVLLFLCGISQIKLLAILVALDDEFQSCADWQLDKVAYATILQMSFLYILAAIVAFAALK